MLQQPPHLRSLTTPHDQTFIVTTYFELLTLILLHTILQNRKTAEMSTSTSANAEWECTSCLRDIPYTEQTPCKIPIRLQGEFDLICGECLRTQFQAAQKSEHSYPIKWQDATLHPRQFPTVFNRHFTAAYEAREKEYNTSGLQRVYCECGAFLAPMGPPSAKTSWLSVANSKLCGKCQARWCLRCAQRCKGYGVPHVCIPERRMSERRHALGGLKKGRDYQICPNRECGKVVELSEACNAMHCQCGTDFCYICGEPADHSGNHWEKEGGGCPRFGEVGSGHEIFDDDDDVDNEDDDAGPDAWVETMIPWEEDDDAWTIFSLVRWAWQAVMAHGELMDEQYEILFGEQIDAARSIEKVRIAMETYNPRYHGGITKKRWLQIVEEHGETIEDWLKNMHSAVNSGAVDSAVEFNGGPVLDIMPDRLFNMVLEADREAGSAWVRRVNDEMVQHMLGQAPPPEYAGVAVFDVGPGGRHAETWRFRSLDMFKNLPAIGFYKLAGDAMLVVPKSRAELFVQFMPGAPGGLLAGPAAVGVQQVEGDNGNRAEGPAEPETAEIGEHAINTLMLLPSLAEAVHFYSRGSDRFWIYGPLYVLFYACIVVDKIFIGRVDQDAYDMRYGLETRTTLKIPGAWLADVEDDEVGENDAQAPHAMYRDVLIHGRYRVDVLLVRRMFAIAFHLYVLTITLWERGFD